MNKGETTKLKFEPLMLDDIIVKDGIEAVGTLCGREPYYLVGGMAAQSYLPTRCRRPTSDLDFSIVRPLNYADFKALAKPVKELLSDKGYDVTEKKHSRAFKLEVLNHRNLSLKLLIEFSRRNPKSFKASRARLERELENVKGKILEARSVSYPVASPEDIVVPKLARLINSLIRNPAFMARLPKEKNPLSESRIAENLKAIARMREEACLVPADVESAEELRCVSDIYDIRMLSEIAGLNPLYFSRVCQDWDSVQQESPPKRIIAETILPAL